MKYEGRANAVVIVEWVIFLIPVGILGILGAVYFQDLVAEFESPYDNTQNAAVNGAVIISVAILIGFLFNCLLTSGVKKGHSTALKIWYILNIIGTVLYAINFALTFISALHLDTSGSPFPLLLTFGFRGGVLWYKVWSINVIMEFTKGLTSSGGTGGIVYATNLMSKFPITEKV